MCGETQAAGAAGAAGASDVGAEAAGAAKAATEAAGAAKAAPDAAAEAVQNDGGEKGSGRNAHGRVNGADLDKGLQEDTLSPPPGAVAAAAAAVEQVVEKYGLLPPPPPTTTTTAAAAGAAAGGRSRQRKVGQSRVHLSFFLPRGKPTEKASAEGKGTAPGAAVADADGDGDGSDDARRSCKDTQQEQLSSGGVERQHQQKYQEQEQQQKGQQQKQEQSCTPSMLASKSYNPVTSACWSAGQPVPYAHVAMAFAALDSTDKRLVKGDVLFNMFSSILALTPEDLLPATYLMCGGWVGSGDVEGRGWRWIQKSLRLHHI
jgi:hypothetical protein